MKRRQPWVTVFLGLCLAAFPFACAHPSQSRNYEEVRASAAEGQLMESTAPIAFQILQSVKDRPVLLEFSIDHCAPCKSIEDAVEDLAEASQGQYLVLRVNVGENLKSLEPFGVEARFPAFLLTIPGEDQPLKRYGTQTLPQLENWLRSSREIRRHSLAYARTKSMKAPKAVLVAGSADNANFGQEIRWIHSWLLSKGLADDEIACFYAKPDLLQYFSDREQFDRLSPFLRRCRASSRGAILRSIQEGIGSDPSAFFLYVTSHGAPPAKTETVENVENNCVSFAPALYLDAGERGCERLSNLTPESIAGVIPGSNQTLKTMVFQGCYSGGFISPRDDAASFPSVLAKLRNVRLFTASKSRKPSFGCHPGNEATFYGVSFTLAAATEENSLEQTDWPAIAAKVKTLVEEQEKQHGLLHSERSEPQFLIK